MHMESPLYLLGVPRELLIHYIFSDRNLCTADLVQLMVVSKEFYIFISKYFSIAKKKEEVFRSLFAFRGVDTLAWFHKYLHYPDASSKTFDEGLVHSARGTTILS